MEMTMTMMICDKSRKEEPKKTVNKRECFCSCNERERERERKGKKNRTCLEENPNDSVILLTEFSPVR